MLFLNCRRLKRNCLENKLNFLSDQIVKTAHFKVIFYYFVVSCLGCTIYDVGEIKINPLKSK